VQGSVDVHLPNCQHTLLTLGKGAHFAEMAFVSPEQLMRYDVVASQVTVCLSLTFEDIDKAMKENNCSVAHMKTRALHFDGLLIRCLRVSHKIFQLRLASTRNDGSPGLQERLQRYQAKLQQLSGQLFQPGAAVDESAILSPSPTRRMSLQRRVSFASADRPAFVEKTGGTYCGTSSRRFDCKIIT
jgi:CRP-like cAMP-binding protein